MYKTGQLIVSIRKHPDGRFKKNEIFKVVGVTSSHCDCMDFLVDIGFTSKDASQICSDCKISVKKESQTIWFSNRHFAPVDYSFARLVLKKVEKEINATVIAKQYLDIW